MKRLAILSTHPIQYNAPLFRMLAQEESIDLKVFYSKKTEQVRFDKDFGQEVTWDVPLTEGYLHESFDAKEKTGRNQLMASIESFNPSALLVYGWNFDGHLAAMRHFHGSVPVWFRGDSTLLDPLPSGSGRCESSPSTGCIDLSIAHFMWAKPTSGISCGADSKKTN